MRRDDLESGKRSIIFSATDGSVAKGNESFARRSAVWQSGLDRKLKKRETHEPKVRISKRDAIAARLALHARRARSDGVRPVREISYLARRCQPWHRWVEGVTTAANALRVGAIVQKDGNLLKVTKHSYRRRAPGNAGEYRDLHRR